MKSQVKPSWKLASHQREIFRFCVVYEPGLLWIEFGLPLGNISTKVGSHPTNMDAGNVRAALSTYACHINVLEEDERLVP